MKPLAKKKPESVAASQPSEIIAPKPQKQNPATIKFEAEIQKKIERNLLFLEKLQS